MRCLVLGTDSLAIDGPQSGRCTSTWDEDTGLGLHGWVVSVMVAFIKHGEIFRPDPGV